MKMSKREIVKTLESVCKVDDEMLLNVGSEEFCDEFSYSFHNLTCQRRLQNVNSTLEIHLNGRPLDNYETSFWHCIYTTKWWRHRFYDPVWDYGQVQCNNTNDTQNEVSS